MTHPPSHALTLADLAAGHFEPLVNQVFRVRWPKTSEDLVLESVKIGPQDGYPGSARQPFSLIFNGTTPGLLLHQHIHPLDHDDLGRQEVFLVPIGQNADGTFRYQASFN
ncbi:DUF6916 family protein [Rhodospirillum rubrum]|uniref:DUF6916 domain-containing protein n=1 Tax=Rhodospirillum rubrum (strain ATCC 11170 / ATH 1.1.1 / DSM 467 / LMG 4362 / NCIMB 8255 / S1) TaxID=269796 RepID=Q2RUE3_RHORT|nr:hypothetical protein [Rhodospirillum rubrum]ABC22252.1 hypothetical protein Rru_A1451 [Rhodospirillum rubrum ATCC 11170]AEO47969.1 hypothetical protein F11_07495 [Rhodospirillum rubrum F11]MBK5953818.1 hypothetical protein [Rhodospirillum rubrum]QXG81894.1 hypothetical protein KUL73_07525 [Rhodospirillum rubrum]HAP99462.1 hypothetical protein [Rhodospirillum rubrum]